MNQPPAAPGLALSRVSSGPGPAVGMSALAVLLVAAGLCLDRGPPASEPAGSAGAGDGVGPAELRLVRALTALGV